MNQLRSLRVVFNKLQQMQHCEHPAPSHITGRVSRLKAYFLPMTSDEFAIVFLGQLPIDGLDDAFVLLDIGLQLYLRQREHKHLVSLETGGQFRRRFETAK